MRKNIIGVVLAATLALSLGACERSDLRRFEKFLESFKDEDNSHEKRSQGYSSPHDHPHKSRSDNDSSPNASTTWYNWHMNQANPSGYWGEF